MSDISILQSNFFHVKNEGTFLYLMDCICGVDENVRITEAIDQNDKTIYSFSLRGGLAGVRNLESSPNCEFDENAYDKLVSRLQRCVADDDAIILTEVNTDGLDDSIGRGTIITADRIEDMPFEDFLIHRAREILGRPEWTTQCCQ